MCLLFEKYGPIKTEVFINDSAILHHVFEANHVQIMIRTLKLFFNMIHGGSNELYCRQLLHLS